MICQSINRSHKLGHLPSPKLTLEENFQSNLILSLISVYFPISQCPFWNNLANSVRVHFAKYFNKKRDHAHCLKPFLFPFN